MLRRLRWLLLAIVLASVLLWQVWHRWQPAEAVAPAPDALQLGQLQLRGCDIGTGSVARVRAWCTDFAVPEDWRQPGGRRIQLRVAVVASDAAAPEPDLVVFLDGGPGGAATEDYPVYGNAFAPLRRRHHVLLVDQRGTGGSNPLSCREQDNQGSPPSDADQLRPLLSRCLDRLQRHADPRFYTTTDAVRDLEAVRRALGGPRLNLLGVSYGTRVAQQYAMHYPQSVRSMVLDSAVPNELMLGNDHARNLEAVLRAHFAACVAEPACRRRFGDPYASLQKLRQQLQQSPRRVHGRHPATFAPADRMLDEAGFASVVRLYAYSPLTAALLPLMIDAALQGHYSPLLGQAQLLVDDVTERLTDGVGLSISCAEDVDGLRTDPADEHTLLGHSLVRYLQQACTLWPRGSRPADFHQPFRSALPVLVLAGEHDPVTPVRYGEAIVGNLPNGRLLLARGQGHAVMNAGCMSRLIADFVQSLDARRVNARCLDRLGPTPAFTDYNGAGP